MPMQRERVGAGDTAAALSPAHANTIRRPRTRPWRWLAVATAILAMAGVIGLWLAYLHFDRTPGELMRYAERRLIGHPKLELVILPMFQFLRPRIERPVSGPLPTLGKGQQAQSLPPQHYNSEGRPQAVAKPSLVTPDLAPQPTSPRLTNAAEIQQAIASAQAGQVLEIAPGTYPMPRSIRIQNGGLAEMPIILRASVPGSVVIESTATEGFHLHAPFWIFENLVIRGICPVHSNCEHAFHVVGKARGTVIRNNRIENFNAQIKVNGLKGDWPDNGLIQYNTLTNTRRRDTGYPVTPIDIVGANNWLVADNLISNFIKGDGNQVSFGVFMKGAGSSGHIERNLIVCTEQDVSQSGTRVGLSFGGGGTDIASCRDQRCVTEHSQGVATNNVVAHCNDFGVYINKSNQTLIAHNTLINTYGIDVRFPSASALIIGNLLDGRIREREEGRVETAQNEQRSLTAIFESADSLRLDWRNAPDNVNTPPTVANDFCGRSRPGQSLPGALSIQAHCDNWTR